MKRKIHVVLSFLPVLLLIGCATTSMLKPVAQEEYIVNLEEGNFIIKDLQVVKGRGWDTKPLLKGWVLNNTSKDWTKVTFRAYLYDSAGNRIEWEGEPASCTFSIFNIKKEEEEPIGSMGGGWYIYGLKNTSDSIASVAKFEVRFIKGEYPSRYIFIMTKPKENKNLIFDDNFISVSFLISKEQIAFTLDNKTAGPIKIDWNQVSYVDVLGKSHKVMHSGVKYINREEPQAPTVIPPSAKIEDIVFPTDYVYYDGEWRDGEWREKPLFPEAPEAKLYKGQSFGVFMPLEINKVIKNYFFTFKIEDIE